MGYRLSSTYCRVRFKLRCFSLCTKIMHNEKSQYIFSTEKFFYARFKTIQFLNIRTLPSLPYVSFQYSSYETIFSPAWFGGSHAKETLVAPFSNIRKLVGWPGTPCWVFTYNIKIIACSLQMEYYKIVLLCLFTIRNFGIMTVTCTGIDGGPGPTAVYASTRMV